MPPSNNNHDLFSASLEAIETSKRVEKYQRFNNDFQRDCNATLDNAKEWIKAELPIVTDYIDPAVIKDELKQSKTSNRRKLLLSALLFEKRLRESIENHDAITAAVMAMHMFNHMWQAKVELHGSLPLPSVTKHLKPSDNYTHEVQNDSQIETREKILTNLIEKGEKLKRDSQIQASTPNKSLSNSSAKKPTPVRQSPNTNKPSFYENKKVDLWSQEAEKTKELKRFALAQNKIIKKKTSSVFSRVKNRIPLRGNKQNTQLSDSSEKNLSEKNPEDSLLDNPNRSAIMVSPGFSDSIDDSLIQARSEIFKDPNASGVTVHKILKAREHQKQEPGSNTIIMKLASSAGKRPGANLSLPEQCQEAVNILSQQFPGYDMVAIRHMAAEKVGVSPQYIQNLNILPEKTA